MSFGVFLSAHACRFGVSVFYVCYSVHDFNLFQSFGVFDVWSLFQSVSEFLSFGLMGLVIFVFLSFGFMGLVIFVFVVWSLFQSVSEFLSFGFMGLVIFV